MGCLTGHFFIPKTTTVNAHVLQKDFPNSGILREGEETCDVPWVVLAF